MITGPAASALHLRPTKTDATHVFNLPYQGFSQQAAGPRPESQEGKIHKKPNPKKKKEEAGIGHVSGRRGTLQGQEARRLARETLGNRPERPANAEWEV